MLEKMIAGSWGKVGIKKDGGYTLLEVLLVLAILAGAGSLFIVRIPHDLHTKGIDISATGLLEDIRETQQAAMAGNSWYKVKFYPSTNQYMVFKQGTYVRSVSLQKEVTFGNSPAELTLLPTGAPVSGLTVILRAGDLERRVIIAPVMGRTRLEIVR